MYIGTYLEHAVPFSFSASVHRQGQFSEFGVESK